MSLLDTITDSFRSLFGTQPALPVVQEPQIKDGTWMGIVPEMNIKDGPVVVFFPMSADMRIVVCHGFWFESRQQVALYEEGNEDVPESLEFIDIPKGAVMRIDLSAGTGRERAYQWLLLNAPSRLMMRMQAHGFNPAFLSLSPWVTPSDEAHCCEIAQYLSDAIESDASLARKRF